jgi:Flp pilus assembly protein TadD
MSQTPAELARRANALKTEGRLEEAVSVLAEIVRAQPASGAAEHNLAAGLGDLGRWAEAEPHLRAAFKKGIDAP